MPADLFSPTGTTTIPLPAAFLPAVLPSKATLLIRSDASRTIGAGHIMRCIALAQEWQLRGGVVTVAANELTDATRSRLAANGIDWIELGAEAHHLRVVADVLRPAWVVLDVGSSVHEHLVALDGTQDVLVIDDLGGHFENSPTLVLNQNAHGPATPYSGVDPARLLRGLDYLLLRDEFLNQFVARPTGQQPSVSPGGQPTVLVAMGGTDPLQLLPDLVERLAIDSEMKICAIASSGHPQLERLQELDRHYRQIALHLDVSNMAGLISQCDLALTSGGTTVWELAYMGVPAVVGAVAEVEQRLLTGLDQIGLFETVGLFENMTTEAIAKAVMQVGNNHAWLKATQARATEVVDGFGRLRVIDRMADETSLCLDDVASIDTAHSSV